MSPLLELRSQKKWSNEGTSRTIPASETLPKAFQACQRIGVTRLADITNMDRLGIPNYSAVLPGTEDYIWVYSGKGTNRQNAKASALMESIERYCSLPSGNNGRRYIRGTAKELSKSYIVIHPDDMIEPLNFQYSERMIMDYLEGVDLFTKKAVLVPAPLVLFRYSPSGPSVNPFAFHHTNGLASGNVLEEAICHALCEVIERDASSLAELRSSAFPFHLIKILTNKFKESGYAINEIASDAMVDEPNLFPMLDLEGDIFQPARNLVDKFKAANISLIIKEIFAALNLSTKFQAAN